AREGGRAEGLLPTTQYQVVMADLRLTRSHGAEGLEIIGYVRERCPWARVIVLTAYGSAAIEAEARRRGADAFLSKPKPLPEPARIPLSLPRRPRAGAAGQPARRAARARWGGRFFPAHLRAGRGPAARSPPRTPEPRPRRDQSRAARGAVRIRPAQAGRGGRGSRLRLGRAAAG